MLEESLVVPQLTDEEKEYLEEYKACFEEGEEISPKELSTLLREKGIIKNDLVFALYLRSKNKTDSISTLRGEFTLNSAMSYREILQVLF